MQLKRKHKTRIALGIAALIILYGILGSIFKFNIDPKAADNVTMVLFVIAIALLFSNRKPKQNNPDETDVNNQLQDTPHETEVNNQLQDTPHETEVNNQLQDPTTDNADSTQSEADEQKN